MSLRTQHILSLLLSAAVGFSAACEDTTDDPSDAGGAEAGKGGSEGGKSGADTGGKASAGTGGKAGSGTGGKASAGTGGKAGSGGQAGSAGKSDADAGADEDASTAENNLPSAFKISFSTTECFGMCPVYSVTLDQSGKVELDGQKNVAKSGKSTKQVEAAKAAEVYEALEDAGYFELKDAYRDEQDGCVRVRTDASSYKWSVEHDGKTKALSQYLGCEGIDALDKVRDTSKLLIENAAISEWIGQ